GGGDGGAGGWGLHRSGIRPLIPVGAQTEGGEPHPVIFAVQDSILERLGLRSDRSDCLTIVMRDVVANRLMIPAGSAYPKPYSPDNTQFLTCATVASEQSVDPADSSDARARVDRAFDLLEQQCKRLFNPAGPYTDHLNTTFSR